MSHERKPILPLMPILIFLSDAEKKNEQQKTLENDGFESLKKKKSYVRKEDS